MIADWDRLRVFHVVASAGSFTKAGQELGLSQSAISRQISDLEERMKVTLFHRHARGLVPTEQGEVLQRAVRDVFLKLKSVEAQITESSEHPSGELRVTTTMALGAMWLTPLLAEFRQQYPDITLTLLLDDRELDLTMREADVALRMLPTRTDSSLIRRHLMYIELKLYAHKAYLERRGRPKNLDDLIHHDLLAFPEDGPLPHENVNWLVNADMPAGQHRQAVMRANSYQALLTGALGQMGIASLPNYLAKPYRELEVVLPEVDIPRAEVFFVYTEELRSSVKVGAFRDFVLKKAAQR
jgi:DNA-binding transcriptional LysR family regulator